MEFACQVCHLLSVCHFNDSSLELQLSFHTSSARNVSSAPVDQPGKVNLTAEEDVEDDDHIPDIRTFRASAEGPHLYADHASGTADLRSAGSPWMLQTSSFKELVLNNDANSVP